tara:strand:+ start:793 stop:1530 length:738 start_codon:yes stop_codon:yes gene_type:complete
MKTAIIIPSRMGSQRFPNKPMAKINGIPMIERVWKQGILSKMGDVYVACCEDEIFNLITSKGGKAIMTDPNLPSGTDRVFAAFSLLNNKSEYESIINLQGDMPLINPTHIKCVNIPLENGFDMGTIATNISSDEVNNENITKVTIDWKEPGYVGKSLDFYKSSKKQITDVYQHVGIYSFKPSALKTFVSLPSSRNEIERKLEQFRAIDFGMNIGITYVENVPISVDTLEDLMLVENILKSRNENK